MLDTFPDASILILTHRVTLSDKLEEDFGPRFVNYQNCTGRINEQCVVMQLDSIWRLELRKFKMVVVDETSQAFLHTGSTVMKDPLGVMQTLHHIIKMAERIIMLDACADDFSNYRMVQCIARIRGVSPRWIRNTYVAPSNRTASVEVCRSCDLTVHGAFRDKAIAKVIQLVHEGHSVYVPCSTK